MVSVVFVIRLDRLPNKSGYCYNSATVNKKILPLIDHIKRLQGTAVFFFSKLFRFTWKSLDQINPINTLVSIGDCLQSKTPFGIGRSSKKHFFKNLKSLMTPPPPKKKEEDVRG
jgi:hypothetical protein